MLRANRWCVGALLLICGLLLRPVWPLAAGNTDAGNTTAENASDSKEKRAAEPEAGFVTLFDGKTLDGWQGDEKTFRVSDGAIIAGSPIEKIPQNEFLTFKTAYSDFELRLQARLTGQGKNAGVQFRSQRIPNHHEMIGYQCDIGTMKDQSIWGALYDESRRRKFLAIGEQKPLTKKHRTQEWNDLRIRCEGPHIQLWVNGVKTVDYTEAEKEIPRDGLIGLQIHSGPPAEASYRRIRIRELKPKKAAAFQPNARLRRPIALAALPEAIFVANRETGSISVIDPQQQTVTAEFPVATQLADLVTDIVPGGLLAIDPLRSQLLQLHWQDNNLKVTNRIDVATDPAQLAVSADSGFVAVTSRWAQRITLLQRMSAKNKPAGDLQVQHVVDLSFAPRAVLWLPGGKQVLTADAFGGRYAVVSTAGKITYEGEWPAHNIRDLALSADGKQIQIAHQILDAYRSTTTDHVFWGSVLKNVIRSRTVASLSNTDNEYSDAGDLYQAEPLGHPGSATGDPSAVLCAVGGQTIVTLAGIDEVAIRKSDASPFERLEVGRRPSAVTADAQGKFAFIANTSDDSVSVLDLTRREISTTIPLGPAVERDLVARGEELFFDAKLSLDGWFSCQSCHTDGHSNGLMNDNFGDGSTGSPKRILTLGGVGETAPWAWNGGSETLTAQLRKSVLNTMQGENVSDEQLAALAAYIKTLPTPPGIDTARGTVNAVLVKQGRAVFEKHACTNCHAGAELTTPAVYDVGVHDDRGGLEFNPPSLRAVSQRTKFFHDNRADSLEAVFKEHKHPGENKLTDRESQLLLHYLRSL